MSPAAVKSETRTGGSPARVPCASAADEAARGGGGSAMGRPIFHALISERSQDVPLGTARQRLPNLSDFRCMCCRQAAPCSFDLSANLHVRGLLSPSNPSLRVAT